jgi:dGTPase
MIDLDDDELGALVTWRRASSGVADTDEELRRHRTIRRLIDGMCTDLVFTSAAALAQAAPESPDQVREHAVPLMRLSEETHEGVSELKAFLYERMYRHWRVVRVFRKAERVLEALFDAFEEDYRQLPRQQQESLREVQPDADTDSQLSIDAYRVITDYIAGMTDRYALQEYSRLYDPNERA